MSPRLRMQVHESQITENPLFQQGSDWTSAAADWAEGMRQSMRGGLYKASRQTDTYVREHPGTIIAGAACIGLAAGWFLGWGWKKARE
jgi:hypothetical protein